jgi:hypothetical protein
MSKSEKESLLDNNGSINEGDGSVQAIDAGLYAGVPANGFLKWNGDSVFGSRGRVYRFAALLLICLLTFGSYFSYDIPGSISTSIQVR